MLSNYWRWTAEFALHSITCLTVLNQTNYQHPLAPCRTLFFSVSMLIGWPFGEPHPSSLMPIPHLNPRPNLKVGVATADVSGASIFKTLLQNGPTHQDWHTILSEGCQWGTWPICYLKAQTFCWLQFTLLMMELYLYKQMRLICQSWKDWWMKAAD